MKYKITVLTALIMIPLSLLRAAEPVSEVKVDFPAFTLDSVAVGNENAIVLCPEKPATGHPWVLAPSFYDVRDPAVENITRTELELVRRGFYVVTFGLGDTFGAPDAIAKWDLVYQEMTNKFGLSERLGLMGLSREGLPIVRWAASHPGKVSCLYMDKGVCDFKSWPGGKLGVGKGSATEWERLISSYHFKSEAEAMAFKENPVDLASKLIADKVPIIYVAGEKDITVPYVENGEKMQRQYEKYGGTFQLIMKHGDDHHPHGLTDPTPIVDFIEHYEQ